MEGNLQSIQRLRWGDIESLKKRKRQRFQDIGSGRELIRKGVDPRKNAEKFIWRRKTCERINLTKVRCMESLLWRKVRNLGQRCISTQFS